MSHTKELFVAALDGLSGLAARDQMRGTKMSLQDKIKWIRAHESAGDEALDLLVALAKALRDKRITVIERNDICSKAEALLRALRSAKEEE